MVEGFEEEFGFRRQVEIIPMNLASEFQSGAKPVFGVFALFNTSSHLEVLMSAIPIGFQNLILKQLLPEMQR